MEASPDRFSMLAATLVSDPVPSLLRRAGHGRVHSVFASVVNLELLGRLVTVTGPHVDRLPNGIRLGRELDFRRLGLRPGSPAEIAGSRIELPNAGLAIELAGAAAWSPRPARDPRDPVGIGARARWRSRAASVRALAAAHIARRPDAGAGLGALISPVAGTPLPTVAALAAPRLDRLGVELRDGDADGASDASVELVGLGPGLTPSGDDALVGIAAAIAVLGGSTAFLDAAARGAPAWTTRVGATCLRHAAAGEFAGLIHELLGALLGSNDAAIEPAVDRALGLGATSGTDTLVGVLAGLDAVAGVAASGRTDPATAGAARRAA